MPEKSIKTSQRKRKRAVHDQLAKASVLVERVTIETSASDECFAQEKYPLTVQTIVDSIRFLNNDKVPDFWPRILLCGINTRDMIDNPEYHVTAHVDNVRTESLQKLYNPLHNKN